MRLTTAEVGRLLDDPTFKAIMSKIRQDQVDVFMRSGKQDTELREDAHSILRALDKIEQALKSVQTEEAIKQKREKGR